MLRLRMAGLALACGLLITLSGCATYNGSSNGDGGLFPRLFRSSYRPGLFHNNKQIPECECQTMDAFHGPVMTTPGFPPSPTQIPITTVPITTVPSNPPQILKVPQAPSTPYNP